MFNLTKEERRTILFLLGAALLGLGISQAAKVYAPVKSLLQPDEGMARIDINQASLQDFLSARAVPKKLAQKILEYRSRCGRIHSLEELKEIKGIGEKRSEKLKELFFAE